MKKALSFLCLAVLLLVSSASALAQIVDDAGRAKLQLGLLIDGSGSISASDFQTVREALADVLSDSNIVPRDGSIELTVVQFSDSRARTEVSPTVITASTIDDVVSRVRNMTQGGGGTPLWLGIDRVTDLMRGSPQFNVVDRQVINVATDGQPRVPVDNIDETEGRQLSIEAVNRAVSNGIDEIDAEGFGQATSDNAFRSFLLNDLVFPQPGVEVSSFGSFTAGQNGFVVFASNTSNFQNIIENKFTAIFDSVGIVGGDDGRDDDDDRRDDDPDTAPGPGGRPVPFDTPMGAMLLTVALGLMLVALRFRDNLGSARK